MKLSARMTDLLTAMQRGVMVSHIGGPDAYFFRQDTMERCTATFCALEARELVTRGHNFFKVRPALTDLGRRWRA